MQLERPSQAPIRRSGLPEIPNGAWLLAVVTAHALVLGGVTFGLSKPPTPITPPAVMGVVLPASAPAAPEGPPKATPAKPKPKPRKAPRPKPRPIVPVAAPSERAVTLPVEPQPPARLEPDLLTVDEPPLSPTDSEETAPDAPAYETAGTADTAQEAALTLPRTDAAHLNNPAPHYPALSRRLGEQGRVLLDIYILPDGTVGDIKLNTSSGYPRLDKAALDAVRSWRFVPAKRGDEPIPYWYVQPVTFSLDR